MKSIAFVSSGFTGSIIPLAKRLLQAGYSVDLYLLIYKSQSQYEFEALEQNFGCFGYGLHHIPNAYIKGINDFPNCNRFNLFLVCHFGLGEKSEIKKHISLVLQKTLIKIISRRIIRKHYSLINVVGHDTIAVRYSLRLREEHLFHTFHEVYLHGSYGYGLLSTVSDVMKQRIPIIVPSKHLFNIIKSNDSTYNVYNIPFGLFESYLFFLPHNSTMTLPNRYLLFLGNILPYKGLKVMLEANEWLKKRGKKIHVVIAGNGHSDLLYQINEDNNYTIFNRWISNTEVAELISKSQGVICPYLSASQSGIPPTTWVFGKKVIVTDVGAMREYVIDGITGDIVPPNNIERLAERMSSLYYGSGYSVNINDVQKKLGHDWDTLCNHFVKCVGLQSNS